MVSYGTDSGYKVVSYLNSGNYNSTTYSPKKSTVGCTCLGTGCKGTCRVYA